MLEATINQTVCVFQDMELRIIWQALRAHYVQKAPLHQGTKMNLVHFADGVHYH